MDLPAPDGAGRPPDPTPPAASAEAGRVGRPGPHNDLTDVAGVLVGHSQRAGDGWLTGTTVVLPPAGTVGGVDVRGAGPSTRETDALAATTLVGAVHAVCLSGGSSYGLAAAGGVMDWLAERGAGLPVGRGDREVVPIVPAACLFDLGRGGRFGARPDAGFGRGAADAATTGPLAQGNAGAGTGALAGGIKGGIGSASVVLAGGVTVAALVAVNSSGSPVDPRTGELYGARYALAGELPGLRRPEPADVEAARLAGLRRNAGPSDAGPSDAGPLNTASFNTASFNTMLAVVATDAALAKHECTRVAMAAHDGMAMAVRPAHGPMDGDVVFALATGARPLPEPEAPTLVGAGLSLPIQLGAVMAAAADTVARAIVNAVLAATTAGELPCYRDLYPSALA